jgi:hypothetical protein
MVQKCDDQNVTYKGTIIRDARQSERGNTSTGPLHHSSPSPSHIIQYIEKSRSKLCRGLPRTLRKVCENFILILAQYQCLFPASEAKEGIKIAVLVMVADVG